MDHKVNFELTAKWSPFTTFCEGPDDIEKGFRLFPAFYEKNYKKFLPRDTGAPILVMSSGPGYFQAFLRERGFTNAIGIDTDPSKITIARDRGLRSECLSPFDWLPQAASFEFIFGEQEINHLTRREFLALLEKCRVSLRPGGKVLLNAANCANPLVASEYPGNNWDHYLTTAEGNLKQAFSQMGFQEVTVVPLDFYVLWANPLNYVAKIVTGSIHLALKLVFRIYGKNASIFTKRLAVCGTR